MNNQVLDKIRKTNLKNFLGSLIPALLFNIPFVMVIYFGIDEGFNGSMIFIGLLFGFLSVFIDYSLYKTFMLIIHPEKSDLLKKYGDVNKISKILDEIEKTKEYEDKNLVISKNYISDKKDIEKIVKCSDVLGVHKLVHKTNYVIDYYKIIITDKYGQETSYRYGARDEELCNELLTLLGAKCNNAELGYHKDEWDHIKNNKVELPSDSNNTSNQSNYEYKCPECSESIEYGDKFCKNCACKLDWDEDETETNNKEPEEFKAVFKSVEEKVAERQIAIENHKKHKYFWKIIGIIVLSIVSSEMILMMILGDSVDGTPALLLTFGCAVPLFALYYYLFIGKNK